MTTIHRTPVDDILPCCGLYVFQLPWADRIRQPDSQERLTCGQEGIAYAIGGRVLLEIADARTGRMLRLRRGQITDSIGRQAEGYVIEGDDLHEEAGFDAALAIAHALSLAGWAERVRRNWLGA